MAAFVIRSACCCMNMARVAVLLMVLLVAGAAVASARPARASQDCDLRDAVYPYWSYFCSSPAVYRYDGGAYKLASPHTGLQWAPEWDESNSTYYIRLADEGATYELSHLTRDRRPYVRLSDSLYFVNKDSGRVLAWRNEGEDEDFLVEVEADSGATQFEFATYKGFLPLPCPLIYPPAECHAYSILALGSTSGLTAYVENDVIYLKKSATNVLPFLLSRDGYSSPKKLDMIASVV